MQALKWGIANTLRAETIAAPVFLFVHWFALLRAGRALKPSRVRMRLPGRGSQTVAKPISEYHERIGFGFTVGLEAPVDSTFVASPGELLKRSRNTALLQLFMFAPVFGILIGLGDCTL